MKISTQLLVVLIAALGFFPIDSGADVTESTDRLRSISKRAASRMRGLGDMRMRTRSRVLRKIRVDGGRQINPIRVLPTPCELRRRTVAELVVAAAALNLRVASKTIQYQEAVELQQDIEDLFFQTLSSLEADMCVLTEATLQAIEHMYTVLESLEENLAELAPRQNP